MRKLQSNEKICPICKKIFRFKRGPGNSRRKYCSDKCYKIAHRRNVDKRCNLGTPSTLSLTTKSVRYQLYLIRNNIDKGAKQFVSDKSDRDVVLERMCYDKDYSNYEANLEELRSTYNIDKELIMMYENKDIEPIEELMRKAEEAIAKVEEQIRLFVDAKAKKTAEYGFMMLSETE